MSAGPAPAKATLFCPECPHRDHAAGDWRRVEHLDGTRLVCPNCETTVVTRPMPPSPPTPGRR